jgi:RimJ/RimL family protein N-acetyltransferase
MSGVEIDRIGFEPFREKHLPLMARWLEAPHVREWWGDPAEELDHIREMIAGRDTTRPSVILLDGRPIGYIQVWSLGDHQNETWLVDHPWLAEFPPETVGVDITISEEALLSKGIGSATLKLFLAGLIAEGHRTIIIDPDPANARAVRAYEKAGFRPVPRLLGKTGDTLIMQFHPNQFSPDRTGTDSIADTRNSIPQATGP